MLKACLDFATKEGELYQLMYMIGAGLKNVRTIFPELVTFISFIHGLISVNYFFKDIDHSMNDKILKDAVEGIVHSMQAHSVKQ